MFHNIPFNFLSFSPKKTIITKHRTLQKYSTFAFNFPLMGPVSLVRLQPTSTLSAGNLIFTLYTFYTFYSATVSLKSDGYCREWIVEWQKWETLKITHTIPSAPFCHITQKLSANRRAHRMKTCKCETDSQYLVQPCSGNTGWSPWPQFLDQPRSIALLAVTEPRPIHIQCCYQYIKNGLSI